MPKVDPKKYEQFKKGMFGETEVGTEEEMSIQDIIQRLRQKAQDLIQGEPDKEQEQNMNTEYKNKMLQISHGDKRKSEQSSIDTPEKKRAGIRRLLQKMQEGPVPDINTEKGLTEERPENPEDNAILRQLEGMEEESGTSLPSLRLRKGRPS